METPSAPGGGAAPASSARVGATSQAAFINRLGDYDWQVTQVGEPIMAGDGPWFVSQVNRVEDNRTGAVEGISVLTIVDDGGVLRVANHMFFGDL